MSAFRNSVVQDGAARPVPILSRPSNLVISTRIAPWALSTAQRLVEHRSSVPKPAAKCASRRSSCREAKSAIEAGVRNRPCVRVGLGFVAGSAGSVPAIAVSTRAASRTVRVIGPAVSWLWLIGTTWVRLTSPTVGFNPTIPFIAAGQVTDPLVSVPIAAGTMPAATARCRCPSSTIRSRIAIEGMGIARLAADRAPAGDRMAGADVGPFAKVGLAEDDRARLRAAARPEARRGR